LKTLKNIRKRSKIFKNIQILSRNVQKYSTFLDADCTEKYSHKFWFDGDCGFGKGLLGKLIEFAKVGGWYNLSRLNLILLGYQFI